MVNNILRSTVKKDYPDAVTLLSLSKEKRSNKQGQTKVLYRVEWTDESNQVNYFTFDNFSSAYDFIRSNFQNI